jgi:hypothetical protein
MLIGVYCDELGWILTCYGFKPTQYHQYPHELTAKRTSPNLEAWAWLLVFSFNPKQWQAVVLFCAYLGIYYVTTKWFLLGVGIRTLLAMMFANCFIFS